MQNQHEIIHKTHFMFLCTVHCNVIIQYKATESTPVLQHVEDIKKLRNKNQNIDLEKCIWLVYIV